MPAIVPVLVSRRIQSLFCIKIVEVLFETRAVTSSPWRTAARCLKIHTFLVNNGCKCFDSLAKQELASLLQYCFILRVICLYLTQLIVNKLWR